MPGTIIEINTKVGDVVKERDEMMILEAMKMENPLLAPADGIVKEILVTKGDVVAYNAALYVIE
jgi:biotin carboxyl carrier protein